MHTSLPAMMADVLTKRIDELRSKAVSELSQLPEYSDAELYLERKKVTVATWHRSTPDGETQIIVQVYCHHLLGIGSMAAEGFTISTDGRIGPLPEAVRLEFC